MWVPRGLLPFVYIRDFDGDIKTPMDAIKQMIEIDVDLLWNARPQLQTAKTKLFRYLAAFYEMVLNHPRRNWGTDTTPVHVIQLTTRRLADGPDKVNDAFDAEEAGDVGPVIMIARR